MDGSRSLLFVLWAMNPFQMCPIYPESDTEASLLRQLVAHPDVCVCWRGLGRHILLRGNVRPLLNGNLVFVRLYVEWGTDGCMKPATDCCATAMLVSKMEWRS